MLNGAEVDEVDEPPVSKNTIVIFELEAYPEPKNLKVFDLRALYARYKNYAAIGRLIGASEGFVRQNLNNKRKRN